LAQERTINVSQLVDEQPVGRLHVWLIVWSFLVLLSDGYDIGAIAYAAPALAKAWHITNRAAFGPVFSSLFIGMLIGAPLLGYLGDRYGRKKAIVAGAIWYGACVLLQTQATSLDQLLWLRLLSGLGIGGILPNVISLNAEYAPRKFRATMVIIMFTGITFGGGVPGPIAAWLMPTYGWQSLFFVGGLVPLLVGIALIFVLPESLRYLTLIDAEHAEIVRLTRWLSPTTEILEETRFIVDAHEERGSRSVVSLFQHGLGLVTPLLWILFMINLMVFYFMNSWIPLIFSDAGLPATATLLAVTVFQWGGTLGGLAIAQPIDRWHFTPIVFFFALGAIVVAAVGFAEHNAVALLIAVGLSGFCTLGLQFGINAMSGLIYPTNFRANGVGWAFGAGRIGSFLGPMIGGALIATHLPFQQLFLYAAIPLLLGLVVSILIIPAYFQSRGWTRTIAAP
jgi:AAHS family 4-hydroxybenzoate transporter-like MFS transporter